VTAKAVAAGQSNPLFSSASGASFSGLFTAKSDAYSSDNTAPVTTATPLLEGFGTVATLSLLTEEPSVVFVEYRLQGSIHWQAVGEQEARQSHLVFLYGLTPNSEYEVRYVLANIEGKQTHYQMLNFNSASVSNLQAPSFSAQPSVNYISSNSAEIQWTNSINAFGQVSYGRSLEDLLDKEANIDADINHQVTLVKLDPATIYYAQVKAYNLLGEAVSSEIVSFVTSAISDHADSDADGLPDVWEIQFGLDPQNANDAFADLDHDGLTNLEEYTVHSDPNNADSDDDGIPDGWEVDHNLDPNNPADAGLDTDGDGVSNLKEYLSATDTEAPVISLLTEITLDSRGPLTAVPTENISASDNVDASVAVVNMGKSHLPPGRHLVSWLAEDSAGNRTIATQIVKINPQLMMNKIQTSTEGKRVNVEVTLSGTAPVYPVLVPFSISGTVDLEDYTLSKDANVSEQSTPLEGTLVFEEGLKAAIVLQIIDDQSTEGDEQLIVTLSDPVNAVMGINAQHQVTVTESNIAPRIRLVAEQNSLPVTTVSITDGPVIISAIVDDLNLSDSHILDWSATNNLLTDSDSDTTTLTFNPENMSIGIYTVEVSVSDDGLPIETASTRLNLRVIQSYPTLSADKDSDGDGISDLVEGYQDSDFDGISDYLDSFAGSSWLQQQLGTPHTDARNYLMQVEYGSSLSLGTLAMVDVDGASLVEDTSFSNSDLFIQYGKDTEFNNVGGLFDFEIHHVAPLGTSVQMVIPLQQAIPAEATYRKLHPAYGWQSFVIDTHNKLYSSAGEPGVCPSPGDVSYQLGLTEGHHCLMMLIQDGGANDADGKANGTVVDPGGVAAPVPASPATTPAKSGGGGCTINTEAKFDPLLMLLLLLAGGQLIRQRLLTR
jgi:hypothetical protein